VLIYLWFAGYVTKTTSQAEQMAASEKLKIEAASLFNNGSAKLHVRNLGGGTVNITTVYILRPGTINPICDPEAPSPHVSMAPGNLSRVDISFTDCTIAAGNDYVIKIVTQKGTEFAVTVTASTGTETGTEE